MPCGAESATARLFVLSSLNSSFKDQQTLKLGSKYLHFSRIIFFGNELGQLTETCLFFERHDGYASPSSSSSEWHERGALALAGVKIACRKPSLEDGITPTLLPNYTSRAHTNPDRVIRHKNFIDGTRGSWDSSKGMNGKPIGTPRLNPGVHNGF
jgi:hypothetical protein